MKKSKSEIKEQKEQQVEAIVAEELRDMVLTSEELAELGKKEQKELTAEDMKYTALARLHDFYSYSVGKDNKFKLTINQYRLINRLRKIGIYRYDVPGGDGFEYVQIKNGKIHLFENEQKIIDAFEDYVRALPDREVKVQRISYGDVLTENFTITSRMIQEKLYNGLSTYFTTALPRLRPVSDSEVTEISTVHDTKKVKYMFYKNTAVRITSEGTELINYDDIHERIKEDDEDNGSYIWDTSIINREYFHFPEESKGGEYERLCWYFCGADSEMHESRVKMRMKCLMSILGYMLHDNYECNNKLALFIDAKIQDGESSGGTGKGLIGKGLQHVTNRNENDRKYISVGGKDFDTSKDTRYSAGDLTTKVIHIEDAKRDLNFESLYNDITEGAIFRKLHHDPSRHFAKIMISTNCPININSSSTRRRVVLFEMSPYFSHKRTPEDVFGHFLLVKSWPFSEWMAYDNFMVRCVELYMKEGLIDAGMLNYEDNFLKAELGEAVYNWMQNIGFNLNTIMEKRTAFKMEGLWQLFNKKYPDKYHVRNSFTKAIKLYLRTKHIPSGILRSTEDMVIVFPDKNEKLTEIIYQD